MVSMKELSEFIIDAEEGDSLLHDAAYSGNLDALNELLKQDHFLKKINSRLRPFGATPLRLAATAGYKDCVQLLIRFGADVDVIDVKAQTSLFVSVKNRHTDCVEELLKSGAHPDGNDRNRCTPLYLASQDGYLEGVKLLLQFGASTEMPFRLFGTVPGLPLHISLLYQHRDCFVTLLLEGAEPDLRFVYPPLPMSVLGQLSLFHCIVHYRLPLEYAQLLVIFGGYLWQRDGKNKLAIELPEESESKQYIKDSMEMKTL